MTYPSIISALATPQASDRLNSPSHSQLHQNENAGITEVQTFVGTLASAAGTLIYDVRSPDSNGGGHIQTANKGGTGQTGYTKGDILVAQSSSVLSKLAVGADGTVLQANSGQAAGLQWSAVIANKISITTTSTSVSGSNSPVTLFSSSILGSTLGTNNAVRFTMPISSYAQFTNRGVQFDIIYGNNTLFSVPVVNAAAVNGQGGRLEGMIVANGATNSQKGYGTAVVGTTSTSVFSGASFGTSSVESSANQLLKIQATMLGVNTFGSVTGEALVLEKIV